VTIYDRLLFQRLGKNFLFSLIALAFLFVVFDMTLTKSSSPCPFFLYYSAFLSLHGEFLIAIAFALALIQTLLDANAHFEFISLQIAGGTILKITKTVFLFSALLMGLNICNFELWYPKAGRIVEKKSSHGPSIERIVIPNGGEIFFNSQLSSPSLLQDLFFIKSAQEIWHICSLQRTPPYLAEGIDRFYYENGKIGHVSTSEEGTIDLSKAELIPPPHLYKYLSLKKLYQLLDHEHSIDQISIHLYYKYLMSCLPLLFALLILPSTTRYYKAIPSLKIYGISLFIFILFYFIIEIIMIVARAALLPPVAIIAFPLALLLLILGITCGKKKPFSLSIFALSS